MHNLSNYPLVGVYSHYNAKKTTGSQAKQLEELDAEFGIGELVEEEVAKDQRKAYGRNHLKGIKVQHHHSRWV